MTNKISKKGISKIIDGLLAFSIAIFTIMCALVGFIFVNFNHLGNIVLFLSLLALAALIIAFSYILLAYIQYIKKLGEK